MRATLSDLSRTARGISVRRFDLPEDFTLPVHWFWGNVYLSHASNALNLLFPSGERFFVRSVTHYLPQLTDPDLVARVRAFAAQEAQHGRAHDAAFRHLEEQGFEYASWKAWYEHAAWDLIEPRVPPAVRLSITAALEHFTATLATETLEQGFLEGIEPAMRELLEWHSVEEIEHKSVAFDVLSQVSGSYALRVLGLVIAAIGLVAFWNSGTRHLLRQDPAATPERLRADRHTARARGRNRGFILDGILSYLRPGFHPDDHDNRGLAADWLLRQAAATAA